MTLNRHTWRLLAAILMIVAYALSWTAHAQAGHSHGVTVIDVALVGHADHSSSEAVESEPDTAPVTVHKHGAACVGCVSLAGPPSISMRRLWHVERLTAPPTDPTHPSVIPEALPKPPRSFA